MNLTNKIISNVNMYTSESDKMKELSHNQLFIIDQNREDDFFLR